MKTIVRVWVGLVLISAINVGLSAQNLTYSVWIAFTDKENAGYNILNPSEFLSERALLRRERQNIAVDDRDLPVSGYYIDSILKMGFTLHNSTKWLNGIVALTSDTLLIEGLNSISFVQDHRIVAKSIFTKKSIDKFMPLISNKIRSNLSHSSGNAFSLAQIDMLNGKSLHDSGYRGEGMYIAVIDDGFFRVDSLPAFEKLWQTNRILGTRDFVNPRSNIFEEDSHGMTVLSIMAGDIPGKLTGTAPGANYWLLRSEDVGSEFLIEEFNWIAAAEFADSVGVDVINTSLGYSVFYSAPEQSYTYEDMDGETAYITRAADIAASKGLLIVVSAGNEGNDPWKYITAPGDADSILTIGAVDVDEQYAYFSSLGPTFDNRIKPDVCAMGLGTTAQWTNGMVGAVNGTSFSSPVIAGLAACLWQAFPDFTNMEIIEAIKQSSNYYLMPNNICGYGIPDFLKARKILNIEQQIIDSDHYIQVYPTLFKENITIEFYNSAPASMNINFFDISGKLILTDVIELSEALQIIEYDKVGELSQGMYLLRISDKNSSWQQIIVKQ